MTTSGSNPDAAILLDEEAFDKVDEFIEQLPPISENSAVQKLLATPAPWDAK